MSKVDQLPTIEEILNDPAASNWLKNSLMAALQRDAVDAANDADLLANLLGRRAQALLTCFRQAAASAGAPPTPDDAHRPAGATLRVIH